MVGVCPGGCLPRGCLPRGGVCLGGICLRGGFDCPKECWDTPRTEFMTHACEKSLLTAPDLIIIGEDKLRLIRTLHYICHDTLKNKLK